jgi:hypothetical protein
LVPARSWRIQSSTGGHGSQPWNSSAISRSERINAEDHSVFNPVLYAADHLVPVIRFGQTDVCPYHGTPAVVTTALTVLGWTLGIAIAAAASRTLTRN